MRKLDAGYTVDIDQIEKDSWHQLMLQFADATYYQTWSYGAIHAGAGKLSHLVLKKDGNLVAMVQARILRIPMLPVGIAHISWGPMWQPKGDENEVSHLRNILRALYNEYVDRRKYLLRLTPGIIERRESTSVKDVFVAEGFSRSENDTQTVALDLSPPLEDIRKNLGRKWRQTLQSGEKKGLGIITGNDYEISRVALEIVHQMKDRKGFFGGSQSEALEVHKTLPENMKLNFTLCTYDGEPVAALGWPTFGSTGLPLVSGTGNKALRCNASYVLWWRMIEYYKTHGFRTIDLAGVDEDRNPGGYYFKTHILGKSFIRPDRYIGHFDSCNNYLSLIYFRCIYSMRNAYRDLRRKIANGKEKREGE